MSVVKGAVIKGDAAFMVILNANYTPTKRKADLFGGAAAADSCTDGVEGCFFFFCSGIKMKRLRKNSRTEVTLCGVNYHPQRRWRPATAPKTRVSVRV